MNENEWISVNDRLPELHEESWEDDGEILRHEFSYPCLCFCVGEDENLPYSYSLERDTNVVIGFYDTASGLLGGWIDDSSGSKLKTVTHWRPLPAPPVN